MIASRTDLERCPDCGGPVRQDDDVLDTWFSSQLVPVLQPWLARRDPDLARFYPGHTLVTAPEILFFWVARMVMAGLEFMGEVPVLDRVPARHRARHPAPQDVQVTWQRHRSAGRRRPLRRRCPALHARLRAWPSAPTSSSIPTISRARSPPAATSPTSSGTRAASSCRISKARCARSPAASATWSGAEELTLADRWIIARCDATVVEVTDAYERYRLNDAAAAATASCGATWPTGTSSRSSRGSTGDQPGGDVARAVVAQTFDVALRLLHPIMPFITEALWQRLARPRRGGVDLRGALARGRTRGPGTPPRSASSRGAGAGRRGPRHSGRVRGAAGSVGARSGSRTGGLGRVPERAETIRRLPKISELRRRSAEQQPGAHTVLKDGTGVFMPADGAFDVGREAERLQKEGDRLARAIDSQRKKLANEQFTARAPAGVVQREREKLKDWSDQLGELMREQKGLVGV